jgi:broad specificity phosphatase PhoE
MTDILLVRHGESEANRDGRYAGRSETSLSAAGRRQAQLLASRLAQLSLDVIYSGPLSRCTATAGEIAARCTLQVRVQDQFTEIDLGPWEGQSRDDIAKRHPEDWAVWRSAPGDLRVPGIEDLRAVAARTVSGLLAVAREHGGQRVAVVTHEAVIRVAVLHCLGADTASFRRLSVDTCSLTWLELVGERFARIRTLNDTSHLSPGS